MEQFIGAPFGDMLRGLRKRRGLTQSQLAEQLGVHLNTIGGWERGLKLPDSKSMVLEVARHLRLTEQESRQLLEASLTALSPPWNVPYQRNPFFTGREEILYQLAEALSHKQAVALTQTYALHGLGGIGKTQTAVEYAYRHALDYSAVFWIGAETPESIIASWEQIAQLLDLPQSREQNQSLIVAAVHRWLSTHQGWLLIWDNIEDLDLLARFLPASRGGSLLLTTRHQALGTLARGIPLLPLTPEESTLLLLRRSKILSPAAGNSQLHQVLARHPEEEAAVRTLTELMGGLPLALDQVGAYVEERACNLHEYLQSYQDRRTVMLRRRGRTPTDYPASVATTWSLSFEQVQQASQEASEVLSLCACLHPDHIPEELFVTEATKTTMGEAQERWELNEALGILLDYSLISRNAQEHTLSIHRLVQAVLRERMSEQERAEFQQRAIRRLNALFPTVTYEVWRQCERLLPHILACAMALPDDTQDQEMAEVLGRAANYQRDRAQYEQAERLYQRALRIWERGAGPEHPGTASALKGLAMLYAYQGKYEQAEALFQCALHIWERALGSEHPEVAALLNNLAFLYREQGKYEQVEAMFYRVLQILKQALGAEHPNVATTLNNLALLYREQGKYEQAEVVFQRALQIYENAIEPEHPQIAYPLNNLATLYREQGKYERAEALFQRALHIREQALGPEHPLAARPLNGLADLYREQGKYEHAEPLYRRALNICERAQGSEHPEVATSLNGLAFLSAEQGKYGQAQTLYERALCIREQHLGPQHPETARSLFGLATLYQKQGLDEQAGPLLLRAWTIFEQRLGPEHPETVKARGVFATQIDGD